MFNLRSKLPHAIAALSLLTTPAPPEHPTADRAPEPKETPIAKKAELPPITPSAHMLRKEMTVFDAAKGIGADVQGFLRWNPPHPNGTLPAGTIVREPPAIPHGEPEQDPRVFAHPYIVRLQRGETLSHLAAVFKVPLEILMDQNCPGGEREARKLKVGTDISIPLVQKLGRNEYALEGLRFNNPMECIQIATRLASAWQGRSRRREHLAVAFQHFSPSQRASTIASLAEALTSLKEITTSHPEIAPNLSPTKIAAYADALQREGQKRYRQPLSPLTGIPCGDNIAT